MDGFVRRALTSSKGMPLRRASGLRDYRVLDLCLILMLLVQGTAFHLNLFFCNLHTTATMQYGIPFAPQSHTNNGTYGQAPFTIDLIKLWHEKEILENGLATCVTYLHVLRKKQARYERLLNHDSPSTRRKRKKVQQRKLELDREIRNKHNDEQAFWSNLQACKANIYVAEGIPYTPTDLISTFVHYKSSTTPTPYPCDESEPAGVSWNGWTEAATSSPFRKRRSNPYFDEEVAPDELIIEPEHDMISIQDIGQPFALIRNAEAMVDLPVHPNTAHAYHRHCSFSPEARIFEPRMDSHVNMDDLKIPSPKTINCAREEENWQSTEAGVTRAFQRLSIDAQSGSKPGRHHSWCNTTSQRNLRRGTNAGIVRRRRSSIL
jgi:hypothetical protein